MRAIGLAPAYVNLAIARWRMLHPELLVTLADGRNPYCMIRTESTDSGQANQSKCRLPQASALNAAGTGMDGRIAPAEAEERYYAAQPEIALAA